MTRKQITLAGAGLAVAVGLAVLYFATRSNPDSPPSAALKPPTEVAATAPSEVPDEGGQPRPELADPGGTTRPAPERRDYIDDNGRMVRDHRRGNPDPIMEGRTEPKTEPRKVGPEVVMSISRALRPIFRDCITAVEDGRFGPDAQVQAELLITIAEDVISVDEVKVKLSEGENADLVGCVSDAAATLSLPAGGHPEISEHWLTFPHRLRR